jgi:hypothetical protein
MRRRIASIVFAFIAATVLTISAIPAWSASSLPHTGARRAAPSVWAVGSFPLDSIPHFQQTLTEGLKKNWREFVSPNEPDTDNVLSDVVALGPNDAWAVGNINQARGTMIEHWDGTAWTITARPNIAGRIGSTGLASVAFVAPDDVWTVGHNGGGVGALVEHWDGAAWNVVDAPEKDPGSDVLADVAAVSADLAWAVGTTSSDDPIPVITTLVERWDGSHWDIVKSPNAHNGSELHSVATTSAGDAWAVGNTLNANNIQDGTLIEHWNGSRWRVVKSPSPGIAPGLEAVAALSPTDAWAVGGKTLESGDCATLIEHWKGTRWEAVNAPNGGCLADVSARSSSDVWAVGSGRLGMPNGTIMHWDGHAWSIVEDPDAGPLGGVSIVPAG